MNTSEKYLEYFQQHKVLFATNGDSIKTPSIEWSKKSYVDITPSLYIVKSNIWALDCFLEILDYASTKDFNYVIYIDADCFIVSFAKLKKLFSAFQNGDFAFAGMPDGGCIPIRIHNKFMINPFFSMFNVKKCVVNLSNVQIDRVAVLSQLDDINLKYLEMTLAKCPNASESNFQIDNFENYYKLFSALAINQKIMYLIAGQIDCNMNPVTAIYNEKALEENVVCLHSWYARKNDEQNLERIRQIYEYSKTLNAIYGQ